MNLAFAIKTLLPLAVVVVIAYFAELPVGVFVTIIMIYLTWFTYYAITRNWGEKDKTP